MLDIASAEYFLREIYKAYTEDNKDEREKTLLFRPIFKEFLNKITEGEKQYFSGQFSRTVYALDKYKVPKELTTNIKKLRYFTVRLMKNKKLRCSQGNLNFVFANFFNAISFFSEDIQECSSHKAISEIISKLKISDPSQKYEKTDGEELSKLRVVVRDRQAKFNMKNAGRQSQIICESDEYGQIAFRMAGKWKETWKILFKGATLNLFDVSLRRRTIDGEEFQYLETGLHSLIVLEPDYLFDVTDLAECFQLKGANINLYFLRKFSRTGTTLPLVIGNIVNSCFDELIGDSEADFEQAYDKAIMTRPLQLFALAMKDYELVRALKMKAEMHFDNLKRILPDITGDYKSVEPSFLSPDYGLQGRLDLLGEYEDDENRKDIIELKSGRAPSTSLTVETLEGQFVKIGMWPNNLAQVTCYNLLLDSAYENRTGSSQILYSGALAGSGPDDYPLRNAPNIIQKKQEILSARNTIIAHERAITLGHYNILEQLHPDSFGDRPPFVETELFDFAATYAALGDIEKDYFHCMLIFILREIHAGKIGANNGRALNGFASLWKDSLEEKEHALTALTRLRLIEDESDFTNFHLTFESQEDRLLLSSLRKGDMSILYPVKNDGSYNPVKQQLVKCSIKEITPYKVKISVRNKQFRKSFFIGDNDWALEPDYLEATNKKLFSGLYSFFKSSAFHKNIILGVNEPEFDEVSPENDYGLSSEQFELFKKAVSAKNYFLLQGPPGTGKTSYMLKAIAAYFHDNTEENILIMAYTNRAVDEICSALKRISQDFPFYRLGSKESSEHTDRLISCGVEESSMKEVFKNILKTRVFVSTVSSVIANPEILQIKNFNTAIIDEASQILESNIIGILSFIPRFIMIGDEKQLPSIVTQSPNHLTINEDSPFYDQLSRINFTTLSSSLFERLLKQCDEHGWKDAFGMLGRQARMHEDIQEFSNEMFYSGSLRTFEGNDWQISEEQVFSEESDNKIERMLASSRVVFINSEIEQGSKLHLQEAANTVEIIKLIAYIYGDDFNENTVGVISPFRAQCAEILIRLPGELRDKASVDTVERFQGSERDIIIISYAVNNKYHAENLPSIAELNGRIIDRKLNVALTRARRHMIIMGNADLLSEVGVYAELISSIREKASFYDYFH